MTIEEKSTEIFQFEIPGQDEFEASKEAFYPFLSELTKEKLENIKNTSTYRQSFYADLLTRTLIHQKTNLNFDEIQFVKGIKGKPRLENERLHFNYSHSGNQIAVILSDKKCGIDIEKIQKNRLKVGERYFSEEEKQQLTKAKDKDYRFAQLWTIKEAYLKYIGSGLSKSLKSFTVRFDDKIKIFDENRLVGCHIALWQNHPNYLIAACSEENSNDNLKIIDETFLTEALAKHGSQNL